MNTLAQHPRWTWVLATVVCVACVALLASRLHYGFLPADDPAFANFAERTLHGDLPNVDFHDNYTGGVSYLNALALRLFGLRLISLRIMLLLFFVPWIAAVWYVASRVTSTLNAAVTTLLVAVWSVPVYPTPYPTWYNLYFATFGTAALFRYIETKEKKWIFIAGICGGVSFTVKIVALYFIAATGLYLLYDEQNENADPDGQSAGRWSAYSLFLTSTLVAFAAGLLKLVDGVNRPAGNLVYLRSYYHFILPTLSVCLALLYRECRASRAAATVRFLGISWRLGLLGAGFVIPLAVFSIPYLLSHALLKWYANLLLSHARLHHVALSPISNAMIILCIPLLLLLLINAECTNPATQRTTTIALFVLLGLVLWLSVRSSAGSGLVWYSVAESLPLLIIISVVILCAESASWNSRTHYLMLLVSLAATTSLVQFPYASPVYFCFVAPALFLLLTALAEKTSAYRAWNSPLLSILVFYLLFGIFALLPGEVYLDHFGYWPKAKFSLPVAAGLSGDKMTVELYERAVPEVVKHAGNAPIYAGPDAGEFYFLTGHENVTPVYWEFLGGRDAEPSAILRDVDANGVRTVVINHREWYSGPPSPQLLAALRERFPQAEVIGCFEIRWKDDD